MKEIIVKHKGTEIARIIDNKGRHYGWTVWALFSRGCRYPSDIFLDKSVAEAQFSDQRCCDIKLVKMIIRRTQLQALKKSTLGEK